MDKGKHEEGPVQRLGWSIRNLARALDCSERFLRKEIKLRRLRALHVGEGRRILIPDHEVRRYLES